MDGTARLEGIRLLGAVGVTDAEGRPVDVGPAKVQVLLATLALTPRTAVGVPRLIDVLWGDAPPRTAEKTLQSYVMRLRKALGAEAVVRVGGAYRLDVEEEAVDVVRFHHRLVDGDLLGALAEWGGTPLAGLGAPGLAPVVQGLVEEWLGAVEQDLERRVGTDAAGTVGTLTQMAATHPLRERLWELLMTALYRVGRQADALTAFRTARAHLVEDLGVEPGPRLRDLEARILAQDAELPVDGPGGEDAAVPGEREGRVPRVPQRLIGREDDLRRVRGALASAAVVTLLGPGGVGKTRLALEVASGWAAGPDEAVRVVDLTQIAGAADVPRVVADEVGAQEAPSRSLTESVVVALRGRGGLLLLDNCEHVIEGAADLVHAVAEGCPAVRVLTTSREPLGITVERILPVDPLPADRGVELFSERAAAVSASFDLAASREEVVHICRRLDGLPLAIELAAARTASLTTGQLVARLDDRFRLLRGRRRGVDTRHRTLRATLQWSLDLLTPQEQQRFTDLSIFTGPFDVAAAHRVTGNDLGDQIDTEDLLSGFVERSLLVAVPDGRRPRYRLLETMRELGAELLSSSGRADRIATSHAEWCREEATRARHLLRGPGELEGAAAVQHLWPDLRAAVHRACTAGDVAMADAVLAPVASELGMRGRLEIGELAEGILELIPTDDEERTVRWLLWATQRHMENGDRTAFDDLVDRYGHADHPLIRHAAANLDGDGQILADVSKDAVTWLREHHESHLADWMEIVGVAAGLLRGGRLDEHDLFVTRLAERHGADGVPTFLHWTQFMLGYSAWFQGDLTRAETHLDRAAEVEVPDGTFSANEPAEARAALRRGELDRALRILASHANELLSSENNMVASRLVGIEFIHVAVASGRLPDAARMLGHLETSGEFFSLAASSVLAEEVQRIETDPQLEEVRAEGRRLNHLQALTLVRDARIVDPDAQPS